MNAINRRGVFFSGAALLATRGAPAEVDSDLQQLLRTMSRQWQVTDAIAEEGYMLPPGATPDSDDREDRLASAIEDWQSTVVRIADTPARSPAGLRAKAEALQQALTCMVLTDTWRTKAEQLANAPCEQRLAWSLAADLIGSVGA